MAMEHHIQFHEWQPQLVEMVTDARVAALPVIIEEEMAKRADLVIAEKATVYTAAEVAPSLEIASSSEDFLETLPATEFLNAIPIVSIPARATQRAIASVLVAAQTEISLLSQEFGIFVSPETPLSHHIVEQIFDRYGCVPNFAGAART